MDAAQTYRKNSTFILFTLALALAAPVSAQTTPAFSLSTPSLSFNQSTQFGTVTVGSTGSNITFTPSISYAADGSNGLWLQVSPSSNITPSTLNVNATR